jgi:hypothetical protein
MARYAVIGIGAVVLVLGLTIGRVDWVLILSGAFFLTYGLSHKSLHRPNW